MGLFRKFKFLEMRVREFDAVFIHFQRVIIEIVLIYSNLCGLPYVVISKPAENFNLNLGTLIGKSFCQEPILFCDF